MTPEISEFSYGFSLTSELIGWSELQAAPIFPTQIEEGKITGGYDVKLDYPAVALFLQFKRAECLTTGRAREISKYGIPLKTPFHRFHITERNRSFQHTSLVSLDSGPDLVYYAAPRFHTLAGINSAWENNRVAERSIFVAPSQIGNILDNEPHCVSYDGRQAWFCSEPRVVFPLSAFDLRDKLLSKLNSDGTSLRDQLPVWGNRLRAAREDAVRRQREIERVIEAQRRESSDRQFDEAGYTSVLGIENLRRTRLLVEREGQREIPVMHSRSLTYEEQMLRNLADEARSAFNALLVVVQDRD